MRLITPAVIQQQDTYPNGEVPVVVPSKSIEVDDRDARYTLHVREKDGRRSDLPVNMVWSLKTLARDMIESGRIVTGYTVHKTWEGRDWHRPPTDLGGA